MTRPLRTRLGVALLVLVAAGCDSALDPEPFGIETVENQLTTPRGAVPFVNGLYEPLQGLYGSNGAPMTLILESGTDDAWPFAQFAATFKERDVTGSEGEFSALWGRQLGDGIGRANFYLDEEGDGDIDWSGNEGLQRQLQGEAYFFRAFYYFNLVRTFGDVPLYTEALRSVEAAQQPRTPTAQVYEQIKADLALAVAQLPAEYGGGGLGQERGRVTSGAARALLAKVHLTLEEWQSVLDVTGPLMGQYRLRPTYVENFYGQLNNFLGNTAGENSVESIFEVQYAEQGVGPQSQVRVNYTPIGTRDGQNRVLPTDANYLDSQPGASGPNAFVQAFEEGDARFDVTLSKFVATRPSVTGTFPARDSTGAIVRDGDGSVVTAREWFVQKWYSNVGNQETRWNIPLFRYAEVLLMRAEAYVELGQAGAAVPLVNQVRERAGLAALTGQEDVRAAVRQERRIELAFEHKRFFDLNRWGILPDVLAAQGVTIPGSKVTSHPITGKPQVLWPVPESELTTNPNATQNAGY